MSLFSIPITEMLDTFPLSELEPLLMGFSCYKNKSVEKFLHKNAIGFSKQGLSQTHLVLNPVGDSNELVGYFSLANKVTYVTRGEMSKSLFSYISKFGITDDNGGVHVAMPLIAQLGKNDNAENVSGSDILELAISLIVVVQRIIGGRLVYLECENEPKLLGFYARNDFDVFGERKTSDDEALIQLIRII